MKRRSLREEELQGGGWSLFNIQQAVEKLILSKSLCGTGGDRGRRPAFQANIFDFLMRECEKMECAVFFNSLSMPDTDPPVHFVGQ